MTDHKFTDKEVIKGLECCSTYSCDGCPYRKYATDCVILLPQKALELVERQSEQIEALKEEVNRLSFWNHMRRTAVIDEFAERLKKKYYGRYECSHNYIRSIIDTLVKEMTGES